MAVVTLCEDDNQKVSCEAPKIGKGIEEILYFPAVDPELGDNSDNAIQEFWVLQGKRLEKFIAETKKYDDAAKALADAKLKLADAKSEAETEAAQEEVVTAQDQMRSTISEGFGKKKDDSVMPVPQGSHKSLIECIGFVNKRTFYISTHDLKKVQDESGRKNFRFDTGMEAEKKKFTEIFKEVATDSNDGTADDKTRNAKRKKGEDGEYVDPAWSEKFFGELKTKIVKEWKFAEEKTEGQVKTKRIKQLVSNTLIQDFLISDTTCELIDSAIKFFNDTAKFSYQQKEQKLSEVKALLSKSDEDFGHYDWGKALLGIQEIWNKTDPKFVDQIRKEKYEEYPKELATRKELIEELYAHKLPKICFDASGGAQFMRYSANCGGVIDFDFTDGGLGIAYKADAKFSLLEAGVEGNYYFPNNLGTELVFDAPIFEECYEAEQIANDGKGEGGLDPMFPHNSSFVLPSAVIDAAQQLTGLQFEKENRSVKEVLIQVAGHADSSGKNDYNTQIGYRRANATHALFTNNKAQWKEYFDRGIWGNEERDMILLSMYLMESNPSAFKKRLENLTIGDTDKLKDVLQKELLEAVQKHDYSINQIQTTELRKQIQKKSQNTAPSALEGQSITTFIDNPNPIPTDTKLIEVYFEQMQQYALRNVTHLDQKTFDLFYIDNQTHPILADKGPATVSFGEDNLKIASGDDEKVAANRRITLIPWGIKRDKQKNTTKINLGNGRIHVHGQVSAFVGATVGMSAHFELNTVEGIGQLIGKKKKEDKVTEYKGTEVTPTDLGSQNATAKVEAFAGAKAEASLSVALEWDNPEKTTEKFGVLASIGGSITGTAGAGIEGEFKIGFDQKTSTFQIKMKVQATWGLGGGGSWCLTVGVQQLFDFIKLVYHKLEENDFNFVDIFENKKDSNGDETESKINVYEVYISWVGELWNQKEYFKAGAAAFGGVSLLSAFSILQDFNRIIRKHKETKNREEETENLVNNIHAKPEVLHFVPPEAKGRMLYKLITYKTQTWSEFFSTDHFKHVEEAAIKVIEGISHPREWQETMENMAMKNSSGDFVPYDKTKLSENNNQRIQRMNLNINYLRNELLNDTDDWDIVRKYLGSLKNWDKAWNMNKMKFEKQY